MKPSDFRILAVDDEPMMVETIADLFKSYQFNVDTANSGNKAWEMIEQNSYDLILSDIRMPDGDGIELAKRVRARHSRQPCILFMSGFTNLLNEELYHIGAEGKFTKPFNLGAVRHAIEKCLLAPEARWSQAVPTGRLLAIEKKGKDIAELESTKAVIFGRGGFFISHSFTPPENDATITFSIEVSSPKPITFKGAGIVRWIQSHGKTNIPPGLGVEITNMSPELTKTYNEMFGNLIPFIPSLGKQQQDSPVA